MSIGMIQGFAAAAGILGVLLVCLAVHFERNARHAGRILRRKGESGRDTVLVRHRLAWVYRIPGIGRHAGNIRTQMFLSGSVPDNRLQDRAARLALFSVAVSGVVFVMLSTAYRFDPFLVLALAILSLSLPELVARLFTGSADTRILWALLDYLGDVKHHYHACGMVEEALRRSNLRAENEMLTQGIQIQDILASAHPEAALRRYMETCHVRFFRLFAAFSHLVREYGDRKQDGSSLYVRNINHIMEEIQMEISKQSQLSYWLRGLDAIALMPLLFPPLIRNWVSASFPVVAAFYDGKAAFWIVCSLFLIVALSNLFIREIQRSELQEMDVDAEFDAGDGRTGWFGKPRRERDRLSFMDRIPGIVPKSGSPAWVRIAAELELAGTATGVAKYCRSRFLHGVFGFMLTLAVLACGHAVEVDRIAKDAWYSVDDASFLMMTGTAQTDLVEGVSIADADGKIIRRWRREAAAMKDDELESTVRKELSAYGMDEDALDVAGKRVVAKLRAMRLERIGLPGLMLSGVNAMIASIIPWGLLRFKRVMRRIDMEQEVYLFHTIILLLMHHESADVRVVLGWMRDFARVFRQPIEVCVTSLQHQKTALERLRGATTYKPFIKIVENLMMAGEDIDVRSAFNNLETERNFYRETRKEANRQQISRKVSWGQMIGFIPIHAVVVLYMVIPMVVSSFSAFSAIQSQM